MADSDIPLPPLAALPSGTPSSSSQHPSRPPKPLSSPLAAAVSALPSQLDVFLARLNKALSTPAGIDTVMLFLCYTSRFGSWSLSALSASLLRRSAKEWIALVAALPRGTVLLTTTAPSSKPSATAAAAAALVLSKRLKAFSELLSEARTILRLWALLGMYFWGKGLIKKIAARVRGTYKGEETKAEMAVDALRLGLCVGLQTLENGAYLAQRGVLGWAPGQIGSAYRWSARFWAAYVGVELGRLLAQGMGPAVAQKKEKGGDEETVEWRKKVARNLAWMPLTLHWSLDKGFVSEPLVGLLASVPGVIQMRDLWLETAKA
ncbi:hypothetical protein QBC47DRAFT_72162 [Echria macrotheca]|uniref:Peroxin 11C n=1 Tax=Echria macrotheca TaxID=438768 RepID=A0AAJ0B4X5_9PEZI|nr:hypothetical protein QBC47DRAFT_72162 [Echria macrotheca]